MILCICFDIFLFLFSIFSQEPTLNREAYDRKHTFVQDSIEKRFTFLLHSPQRRVFLPFKVFPTTKLGKEGGRPPTENLNSGWLEFTFKLRARKPETKTNCNAFGYVWQEMSFPMLKS